MKSASARKPATSYSPRTTTPFSSCCLRNVAVSSMTAARSSPSASGCTANTEIIMYLVIELSAS